MPFLREGKDLLVNSFDEQIHELSNKSLLLTGEHLLEEFEDNPRVHYRKIDFLVESGTWRKTNVGAAVEEDLIGILVAGHGARHLKDREKRKIRKSLPRVDAVWATNIQREDSLFHCLPIGLTNSMEDDGPLHKIFGDQSLIAKALSQQAFANPAIYSNFKSGTSPKHRRPLNKFLKSSSNTYLGTYDPSSEGRLTYLRQMRKHGFVVCPRGRGLDTHRFFEALCLGAIPILKSSEVPKWTKHLSTRSFVTVNSWLDLGNLDFEDILSNYQPPIPKQLSAPFWVEKILSSRIRSSQ